MPCKELPWHCLTILDLQKSVCFGIVGLGIIIAPAQKDLALPLPDRALVSWRNPLGRFRQLLSGALRSSLLLPELIKLKKGKVKIWKPGLGLSALEEQQAYPSTDRPGVSGFWSSPCLAVRGSIPPGSARSPTRGGLSPDLWSQNLLENQITLKNPFSRRCWSDCPSHSSSCRKVTNCSSICSTFTVNLPTFPSSSWPVGIGA